MITTVLQGRLGNQFYQIAMMIAYAKKHGLEYYIPNIGHHCDGAKMYFPHLATGPEIHGYREIHELQVHAVPKGDGTYHYNVPAYTELPPMDNIKFVGYWQSFKYFDWCRDYILEKFNLPYEKKEAVGIHCRFGDFVQLRDKHPEIPVGYYTKALQHFYDLGYRNFYIFTDDHSLCAQYLIPAIYNLNDIIIDVQKRSEIDDMIALSECEHQVLCYSTFGFVAAWLNRNPEKQVIIPPSRYNFAGANADMIPDYFTQLEF